MPLEGDRTKCSSMEAKQMTASHATPTIPEIIHSTPSQPPTQTIKPLEAQKPLTLQFLEFFLFSSSVYYYRFFSGCWRWGWWDGVAPRSNRSCSWGSDVDVAQRSRQKWVHHIDRFFLQAAFYFLYVCVCVCVQCVCVSTGKMHSWENNYSIKQVTFMKYLSKPYNPKISQCSQNIRTL